MIIIIIIIIIVIIIGVSINITSIITIMTNSPSIVIKYVMDEAEASRGPG